MRILIYGLAKSGTTGLHLLLLDSLSQHLQNPVVEAFEAMRREGEKVYSNQGDEMPLARNIVVKALFPGTSSPGADPETIIDDYSDFDKKILIVRDPRDRWISAVFYRWFKGHTPDKAEFDKALRLTRHKEQYPQDLPFYALVSMNPGHNEGWAKLEREHLAKMSRFAENARDSGWFCMKYEDMMSGHFAELEAYVGFPVKRQDKQDRRYAHVARSKKFGNWRIWFTQDDVTYYRPIYSDYLKENGYDSEDWKLTPVESLPASEGSEYIKKLYFKGKTLPLYRRILNKLTRILRKIRS